jgi:glycosyltransferase involved in cell wall biosynthesis
VEPRSQQRSGGRKTVFVNRFFHPDESATSRMLSDLAFRLARGGLPVVIITSRQLYDDPAADLPAHEVIEGVEVWRIRTTARGRRGLLGRALDYATFHLNAFLKLAGLLRRGDVVVAKTDPPLISILVAVIARWRGALMLNWLQDLFPEVAVALAPGVMPRGLRAMLTGLRDWSLRRAAMNVVIGDGMRGRLLARGIHATRVSVIPNWADAQVLVPMGAEQSSTRARLGLAGKFVIGYSGNFGRAHEFQTLLAAAKLLGGDSRFVFLMTGGGARTSQLRDEIHRAGLASFVFQGYQPADLLSDSLAAADLHLVSLLPSMEGLVLPSKVYGILAAGRPVVFIGDTEGDIAALVREHACGISVAVGEGPALATALRTLQAQPLQVQAMAANARRIAVAQYTSEHAVASWLRVLDQVR